MHFTAEVYKHQMKQSNGSIIHFSTALNEELLYKGYLTFLSSINIVGRTKLVPLQIVLS